jgi:uncharacterized membrane protein YkvA (DUF1232 family)
MVEFLGLMKLVLGLGTLVILALLIMLSLPQSQLPRVFGQAANWMLAGFCALYALSPIDILPEALLGPFGLFDDAVAIVAGVSAGVAAWRARHNELSVK